jgi:hypothetical protein
MPRFKYVVCKAARASQSIAHKITMLPSRWHDSVLTTLHVHILLRVSIACKLNTYCVTQFKGDVQSLKIAPWVPF